MNKEEMKMSKFISLVLRHKPQEIDLLMDRKGYVLVRDLVDGMNQKKGFNINIQLLEKIVMEDDKQRYSFNEDKTLIKANQGHSVFVDLDLKAIKPPKLLFHGTAKRNEFSIYHNGIKKQKRQFVHLSDDIETARKVGKRHGQEIIIKVESEKMFEDGWEFFLSDNGVWLTDYVPSRYVCQLI